MEDLLFALVHVGVVEDHPSSTRSVLSDDLSMDAKVASRSFWLLNRLVSSRMSETFRNFVLISSSPSVASSRDPFPSLLRRWPQSLQRQQTRDHLHELPSELLDSVVGPSVGAPSCPSASGAAFLHGRRARGTPLRETFLPPSLDISPWSGRGVGQH